MKRILTFILFFGPAIIQCQNSLRQPVQDNIYEQSEDKQEWITTGHNYYEYDKDGRVVTSSKTVLTNPWKRELPEQINTWEYDREGRITENTETNYYYFENSGELNFAQIRTVTDSTFSDDGHLTSWQRVSEERINDQIVRVDGDRIDYVYDLSGSLNTEIHAIPDGGSLPEIEWIDNREVQYQRNADGRVLRKETFLIGNNGLRNYSAVDFSYDIKGELASEQIFLWLPLDESWLLRGESIRKKGGNPTSLEVISWQMQSLTDTLYTRESYQYDDRDLLIFNLLEAKESQKEIWRKTRELGSAYDSQDRLIEKSNISWHGDPGTSNERRIETIARFYYNQSGSLSERENSTILIREDEKAGHFENLTSFSYECDGALVETLINWLVYESDSGVDNGDLPGDIRTHHAYGIAAACGDEVISQHINIFPNPARDIIFLQSNLFADPDTEVQLFDMSGREIRNPQINVTNRIVINLSGLETGAYFVRVTNRLGSFSEKIMVAR